MKQEDPVMNRIRVSGWILLLSLALAPACRDMPFNINFDAFSDIVPRDLDGAPLEDAHVDQLISTLDSLLNPADDKPMMRELAASYIRGFRTSFRRGRVSPEQAERVLAYFEELKSEHPRSAEMIEEQRRLFAVLTPGMVAQPTVGTDTDGVRFALEDYRGNIVVLVFSGEWCGPCREEYPYQRELMEKYADEPVVLLGVNSDDELATIQEAKVREELHYRTWWDGSTSGPISEAWNVWGWPSTFIMDADGVIRFVNKRQEGMFGAVDRLLEEMRATDGQSGE